MKSLILLCATALIVACGEPAPETLEVSISEGYELTEGSYPALAVLEVANTASLSELDHDVGLDKRAAANIVAARETGFRTIEELDAVSYVGARAFGKLEAYAEAQGLIGTCGDGVVQANETCDGPEQQEQQQQQQQQQQGEPNCQCDDGQPGAIVHGIEEGSPDAEAILKVANGESQESLDDEVGLDSRAAAAIAENRPLADLTELDAQSYVGARAFEKLLDFANAQAGEGEGEGPVCEGVVSDSIVHEVREGTDSAIGILRVANETDLATLDDAIGLDARAAAAIVADRPFETLEDLDAARYVGQSAFAKLLGYAEEHTLTRSCEEGEVCTVPGRHHRITQHNGFRALWLPRFNDDGCITMLDLADDATFVIDDEAGTANITATAIDDGTCGDHAGETWKYSLNLSLREGPGHGGPKVQNAQFQPTEVTDTWTYYDITGGNLSNGGASVSFTNYPADNRFVFQFGQAASGVHDHLGAAVWFYWKRTNADGSIKNGNGDLNVDMTPYVEGGDCPAHECEDGAFAYPDEVSAPAAYNRLYCTNWREDDSCGLRELVETHGTFMRSVWSTAEVAGVRVLSFDTASTKPLKLRVLAPESERMIEVYDPGPWTAPTRGWLGEDAIDLVALLADNGLDCDTPFSFVIGDRELDASNTHRIEGRVQGEWLLSHNEGGIDMGDRDANEPNLLIIAPPSLNNTL